MRSFHLAGGCLHPRFVHLFFGMEVGGCCSALASKAPDRVPLIQDEFYKSHLDQGFEKLRSVYIERVNFLTFSTLMPYSQIQGLQSLHLRWSSTSIQCLGCALVPLKVVPEVRVRFLFLGLMSKFEISDTFRTLRFEK